MKNFYKTLIHDTFEAGILLKGINGALEIIGGILLLAIHPRVLNRLATLLTEGELSRDPHDRLANFFLTTATGLSVSGRLFGALYLLSHGVIKLFLIISLYKKRLWAYPAAIAVFALFIIYQMYRYTLSHSVWMIALSVLDVFVIILTWLEYDNLKKEYSLANKNPIR